jgi:hypothetical protein
MVKRWKAALRTWLVQLVRDAIRLEFPVIRDSLERAMAVKGKTPIMVYVDPSVTSKGTKPASNPLTPTIIDPSFEQLQADAIMAQGKFYEPQV